MLYDRHGDSIWLIKQLNYVCFVYLYTRDKQTGYAIKHKKQSNTHMRGKILLLEIKVIKLIMTLSSSEP